MAKIGGQLAIERVYLRDVSFESPRAPKVFGKDWKPNVQFDINTRAEKLDDERHEVVLTLTIEMRTEDDIALIVELQQAGIFRMRGIDDAAVPHILATICPNALFPYARETVDSLLIKGTFPPLMLAPINFEALYADAQRRNAAQQDDAEEVH